jgi:hypothetical protein
MDTLRWATAFRDSGYIYIPLKPNDNTPMYKGWRKAQLDTYPITEGNYGLALTETQLVVDSDPRGYMNGENTLHKLLKDVGGFGPTFLCRTGRGGAHFYFNKPANVTITKNLAAYPGIDFLSTGQFVVGAGSVVKNRPPYIVLRDGPWQVADAPNRLLELFTQAEPSRPESTIIVPD